MVGKIDALTVPGEFGLDNFVPEIILPTIDANFAEADAGRRNRLRRIETGKLDEYYFGYMVLRPTPITPIGRTVLSIHARAGAEGAAIIDTHHHVHVLGYRLEVRGFPFMQQHKLPKLHFVSADAWATSGVPKVLLKSAITRSPLCSARGYGAVKYIIPHFLAQQADQNLQATLH